MSIVDDKGGHNFIDGDPYKPTEELDCTDMMRGVFKACAISSLLVTTMLYLGEVRATEGVLTHSLGSCGHQ